MIPAHCCSMNLPSPMTPRNRDSKEVQMKVLAELDDDMSECARNTNMMEPKVGGAGPSGLGAGFLSLPVVGCTFSL